MHLRSIAATLLLLVLATGSVAAQGERTSTSNYVNCLSGNSFGCNRDRLTDAQRREVRQAELQRNYVNCLSGNAFGCNRDRLTDAQRREVHQAELQRNYVSCLSGNAFGCNRDRLTDAQRREVHQAELQRNYVNCLSGNAFGCNQNRLTDAQRSGRHCGDRLGGPRPQAPMCGKRELLRRHQRGDWASQDRLRRRLLSARRYLRQGPLSFKAPTLGVHPWRALDPRVLSTNHHVSDGPCAIVTATVQPITEAGIDTPQLPLGSGSKPAPYPRTGK